MKYHEELKLNEERTEFGDHVGRPSDRFNNLIEDMVYEIKQAHKRIDELEEKINEMENENS